MEKILDEAVYARKRRIEEMKPWERNKHVKLIMWQGSNTDIVDSFKQTSAFKDFNFSSSKSYMDIKSRSHQRAGQLVSRLKSHQEKLNILKDVAESKKAQEIKTPTMKNTSKLSFTGSVSALKDPPSSSLSVDPKPVEPSKAIKSGWQQRIKIISASDDLKKIMTMRNNYFNRENDVKLFCKNKLFKNLFNAACSQITNTSETIRSLVTCYNGTDRRNGPRTFLKKLLEKLPQQLPFAYQAIANHLLQVFCSNLSSATVKSGELRFSLVYMAMALSLEFDGFGEILFSNIFGCCPYAFPGILMAALETTSSADSEKLMKAIGRRKEDSDATYLLRMQGMVAFMAAFCQIRLDLFAEGSFQNASIGTPMFSPDVAQSGEAMLRFPPFGNLPRITFGWRFIAGHLNAPVNRFLPYILMPFMSVCGFEMCKQIGADHVKKLLKVIVSESFVEKCKKHGSFKHDDSSDFDRFAGFISFFKEIYSNGSLKVTPPGKKSDARILQFEVQQQA